MSKNRSRDEDLIQRMSKITLKHVLKIINVFECLEGTKVIKVETIVIKAEEIVFLILSTYHLHYIKKLRELTQSKKCIYDSHTLHGKANLSHCDLISFQDQELCC